MMEECGRLMSGTARGGIKSMGVYIQSVTASRVWVLFLIGILVLVSSCNAFKDVTLTLVPSSGNSVVDPSDIVTCQANLKENVQGDLSKVSYRLFRVGPDNVVEQTRAQNSNQFPCSGFCKLGDRVGCVAHYGIASPPLLPCAPVQTCTLDPYLWCGDAPAGFSFKESPTLPVQMNVARALVTQRTGGSPLRTHDVVSVRKDLSNPASPMVLKECAGGIDEPIGSDNIARMGEASLPGGTYLGLMESSDAPKRFSSEAGSVLNLDAGSILLDIVPGWNGDDGLRYRFVDAAVTPPAVQAPVVAPAVQARVVLEKGSDNFFHCILSAGSMNVDKTIPVSSWMRGSSHKVLMQWDAAKGAVSCLADADALRQIKMSGQIPQVVAPAPIQILPIGRAELVCVEVPKDAVAYYAGEGTSNDGIGSYHGNGQGSAFFSAGKVGQAFTFDSDSAGMIIPHNDIFNVNPPGFTVEFWMKGSKIQPHPLFDVVEKSHGFGDSTGWTFQGDSATGMIAFSIGQANGFVGINGKVDVLDNAFHHVVGTWDGSFLRLYVDGALQGAAPITSPANNNRAVNLGFAWGGGARTRFFRGVVDELKFYRRALSQDEIQAIFNPQGESVCKPKEVQQIPSGPQCSPAPSGLVSWYAGEGNANDMTGQNRGSPDNGVSYAEGKVGRAFSFDGGGRVMLGNQNSLNVFGRDLSISAWVFPREVNRNIVITNRNVNDHFFGLTLSNGRLYYTEKESDPATTTLESASSIRLNAWSHITVTRSGDQYALYIDGRLDKTMKGTLRNPWSGQQVVIGDENFKGQGPFKGLIDELQVFNRALSESEIAAMFQSGSAGICANAVLIEACNRLLQNPAAVGEQMAAYYPFDVSEVKDGVTQNRAVAVGNPQLIDGKRGRAFSFNGQTDYFRLPDSSHSTLGYNPITIALWVKLNRLDAHATLVNHRSNVGGYSGYPYQHHWGVWFNPSVGLFFGSNYGGQSMASGNAQHVAQGSTAGWDTNWHHVAVVSDGKVWMLYKDGVKVAESPITADLIGLGGPFTLGADQIYSDGKARDYLNGALDDVRMYHRDLSPQEIKALAAQACDGQASSGISGPVAYFKFEGNAQDSVGNNHGAVINAGFQDGKVGKGIYFGGDAGYVRIPQSPGLDITGTDATITAWISHTAPQDGGALVWNAREGDYGSGDKIEFSMQPNNVLQILGVEGGVQKTLRGNTPIPADNNWHHVAAVFSKEGKRLYVNGVLDASDTAPVRLDSSGRAWTLGSDEIGRSSVSWKGGMDEVRIYPRALSAGEIGAVYSEWRSSP